MKKIIILFIILSLTGCSNQTPNNKESTTQNSESAPVKADEPTSKPQESQQPTAQPKESQKPSKPQIVSSYKTKIMDNDKERTKNIELAISAINGTVIKSGEIFSFNGIVGKRSAEKGYEKAIIYVDDEKVEELGGGICQLSSTIFLAAKKGKFEIVERHEHTLDVPYAKKGNDAAVSYGELDFRFKNNKDFNIIVETSMDKKYVYVTIKRE